MSAYEIGKELLEIAVTIKNKDLHSKIHELNKEIADIQQENLTLKKKVADLEDTLNTKESLTFEDHVYWSLKNGKKDGPFCSKCWDVDKRLVRLRTLQNSFRTCPNCKNGFDSGDNSREVFVPRDYSEL